MRAHYWSTATWVATVTFPVAVVLIDFPRPVATTLFGSRYAGAAPMLAVLGVAFYLSAAFGLNGSVLQVAGRLRALTVANLVGLAIAPAASIALIPRFHGMGAAIAVALAVAIPQLIKQRSLGSTPVGSTHRGATRLWLIAPALIAAAACAHLLFRPGLAAAIAIAAVAAVVLFLCMRSVLDVAEVFPIAAPLLRRIDSGLRRVRWPAHVTPGSADAEGAMPNGLGAWHGIDWRFLLPSPDFSRVWLAAGCAHEEAALEAVGLVTTTVADDADVAFVDARAFDPPALEQTLPGGTLVRIAFSREAAAAGRQWSARPWSARCRQLRARGWQIEAAAWAAPNVRQPRAYALVNDRLAIRRLLRISPAGWSGVVRARLGLALTRVGLAQVVCREGILLARTPK